jgi:hypothetical protein
MFRAILDRNGFYRLPQSEQLILRLFMRCWCRFSPDCQGLPKLECQLGQQNCITKRHG